MLCFKNIIIQHTLRIKNRISEVRRRLHKNHESNYKMQSLKLCSFLLYTLKNVETNQIHPFKNKEKESDAKISL